MIDIELIRSDPHTVETNVEKRGGDPEVVSQLLELDDQWRALQQEIDSLRAQQNEANAAIADAGEDEREQVIAKMRGISQEVKDKEALFASLEEKRLSLWSSLPNILTDDVPEGGEDDFQVVRSVPEEIPAASFEQKTYFELAEGKLFDLERAAKVSGARFVYIEGTLARLQMALVSFTMDALSKHGFVPVLPPVLISEEAMDGMGYLGNHADEVYKTQDNSYLTGTSEQSIGPMHMGEILEADALPLRYVGYSPCFRREAGSHGKDVRGMLRLHQFDKVEMFSFTAPDQSEEEHEFLLSCQEEIMKALNLPYRVVKLASRDLGASSAKTYDIETWIPGEQTYRETHSTSNTTDYQARRLNIRVRQGSETVKAHMLNGTALAMSRILIALMEHYQQEDGSIVVPDVLAGYVPFTEILPVS